jgi:hypothetical protein
MENCRSRGARGVIAEWEQIRYAARLMCGSAQRFGIPIALLLVNSACETLAGIGPREVSRSHDAGKDVQDGVFSVGGEPGQSGTEDGCRVTRVVDAARTASYLDVDVAAGPGLDVWCLLWRPFAGGPLKYNAVREDGGLSFTKDVDLAQSGTYGPVTLRRWTGSELLGVYTQTQQDRTELRVRAFDSNSGATLASTEQGTPRAASGLTEVGGVATIAGADPDSARIVAAVLDAPSGATRASLQVFDHLLQLRQSSQLSEAASRVSIAWSPQLNALGVALLEPGGGRISLFDAALNPGQDYRFSIPGDPPLSRVAMHTLPIIATSSRFVIGFNGLVAGSTALFLTSVLPGSVEARQPIQLNTGSETENLLLRLVWDGRFVVASWLEQLPSTRYKLMLGRYNEELEAVEPPLCVTCEVGDVPELTPYGLASGEMNSYAVAFVTNSAKQRLAQIRCGR